MSDKDLSSSEQFQQTIFDGISSWTSVTHALLDKSGMGKTKGSGDTKQQDSINSSSLTEPVMSYETTLATKEAMRDASNATVGSWQRVKRIARYLRPLCVLSFRWTLKVVVVSDWAGRQGTEDWRNTYPLRHWEPSLCNAISSHLFHAHIIMSQYMGEMRHDTSCATKEVMRDASNSTVGSLNVIWLSRS